jgi:hypothetical protein
MGTIIGLFGLMGFLITLVILVIRAIRKKSKKVAVILLPCFFVCFIIGVIITPTTPTTTPSESAGSTENSSTPVTKGTTPTPAAESNTVSSQDAVDDGYFFSGTTDAEPIADIVSDGIAEKLVSFGFTDDEAQEIRKTFIMCGVSSLEGCEPTDPSATIDGLVSFRAVWAKEHTFWFTVDNREVFYIALNGVDVYDTDKGGFLINVNDIHVPESDVSSDTFYKLQDFAMAAVDSYLKYPNSAYYDAWAIARADDKYMIQGEVQAKNALGTKEWLNFKVWFDNANGDYAIEGITIDGNRVK